jgi:hypothetical protein
MKIKRGRVREREREREGIERRGHDMNRYSISLFAKVSII